MILVTLILALELVQQTSASNDTRSQEIVQELEQAVTDAQELQESLRRNQERLDQLRERLSQGATRLNEAAGIDMNVLQAEVADQEQKSENLEQELAELQIQRREADRQTQETERLRQEVADETETIENVLEEIQRKRQSLDELKESKRVIYNRTPGERKTAWLVEITAARMTAAKAGVTAPPQTFPSVAAFAAWLAERNADTEYFVLLVKPSGITNYAVARKVLQQNGFGVGYDVLPKDQQAIDPVKGAGVE
jgi:hypothetical protein